ncbi:putative transposase [Nocardia brasiliensis NBRC 14402]|nr:putative transposase [Nocardia brasiliensis NBRC 14402]SUB40099.1 Uncharacterised protein [Nocardia brasiliensis]
MRDRGIIVRIARKGIESSERLGRNRWVIERTSPWLTGYHQLNIPAATLTRFRKLMKAKPAT